MGRRGDRFARTCARFGGDSRDPFLNEPDPLEATQLFEAALEKRTRLGPEATLMLLSELGLLWLKTGKLGEAKTVVESGKVAVEDLQVCERSARRFSNGSSSLVPW